MKSALLAVASVFTLAACSSGSSHKPAPAEPPPIAIKSPERIRANMVAWCAEQPNPDDVWLCRCMDYPDDGSDAVCEDSPYDPYDQIGK